MRNLKKIIALVLAVTMVLSTATVAFAADTTAEKATVLNELGLFAGTSTTAFVPNIEGTTNREQAIKMIVEAFAIAVDMDATSEFTTEGDVSGWAQPYVAAGVDAGITDGIGNGLFGGQQVVSTRELMTWIDRQLGVEDAWNANSALASDDELLRGDLVDAIYAALTKTPAGADETLIETIIGDNANLEEIAAEAGLIEKVALVPTLTFDDMNTIELKADGASSTLVKFSVTDAAGNLVELDGDYEVLFSTTYGTFAESRVTSQDGVASVLLTSEFLTETVIVDVTAQIIETEREQDELVKDMRAQEQIVMTPNPGSTEDSVIGARITAAEANEADRIILYFDKDVTAADYLDDDGLVDEDNLEIAVYKDSDDDSGTMVDVLTLAPLVDADQGEVANALQVILDVDDDNANALTDNSDVYVVFKDLTKTIDPESTEAFKLTDVRKPSMLTVYNDGLKSIKIEFSEAVLGGILSTDDDFVMSAENPENWQINGVLVSDAKWGDTTPATVTVGSFDADDVDDTRHIVTITLGEDLFGDQLYFQPGTYSVQGSRIGDYAMLTDDKNEMNTQTLDFTIAEDNTEPVPTIEVLSPEQYLLTWNCEIDETAADLALVIAVEEDGDEILDELSVLDNDDNEDALVANVTDDDLEFVITSVDIDDSVSEFLIEVDLDWTVYHDTEDSFDNYHNFVYTLVFADDAATNVANGKTSDAVELQLNDEMRSPDVVSPTITDIEENDDEDDDQQYNVVMSEPVKLNADRNTEGSTASQEQGFDKDEENWKNVPTPTVEFISADFADTIPGTIVGFDDELETIIIVEPDETLDAGDWTVVVRSISDDVGNTASSLTKDFTVTGEAEAETTFEIAWILADIDMLVNDLGDESYGEGTDADGDDDEDYDYVYIKFTEAVATSGDYKNALKNANYTLDGHTLPVGTQVVANIEGYDDFDSVIDSVTIKLPDGTLEGKNAPHNINVSKYIENKAGDEKVDGGEFTLRYEGYTYYTEDDTYEYDDDGNIVEVGGEVDSDDDADVRPFNDQMDIELSLAARVANLK